MEQNALISTALDDGVRVYATDRGIEELTERRGEEQVSVEWLAERLRAFVECNPAFEDAVERLASFWPATTRTDRAAPVCSKQWQRGATQ